MTENTMRKMTKSDFGIEKANKSTELNPTMSISPSSADKYTQAIKNPNRSTNEEA